MTTSDFVIGQLALRAWRDGHSEGLNGMLAVAYCFRNRIRAGWWNSSWLDVLAHHREVSYKTELEDDSMPEAGDYAFHVLFLQQLDGIFDGSSPDTITTSPDLPPPLSPQYVAPVSLFYGRLDQITSTKFLLDIARNPEHKRVASVGALTFFS